MMAAIFIAYSAIVWLVFDKLRLIRLSLPLALLGLAWRSHWLRSGRSSPSTSSSR
mgnify:CR=1 FL=1